MAEENQKQSETHETGCLICGAPLVYLEESEEMTCSICHRKEMSQMRCEKGHFVCNACHAHGVDQIVGLCLQSSSKNPVEILDQMMALPFCHMHGPEHHIMVGAALLTAYHNAGGKVDLPRALSEMQKRGGNVPGGACGYWGACGAAVSAGIFMSIIQEASPLSSESFGLANLATSESLRAIGTVGGPRCCKRDSWLSILCAVRFVKEHFGIEMEKPARIRCCYIALNSECIRERCPFYDGGNIPSSGS